MSHVSWSFAKTNTHVEYVRYGAWDMDQRVDLVEEGHHLEMAIQEELLEADFGNGEEYVERSIVLEGQDVDAVFLSQLSYLIAAHPRVQRDADLLREGVCDIVQGPVEHLDQEGKLLQDPAGEVHARGG